MRNAIRGLYALCILFIIVVVILEVTSTNDSETEPILIGNINDIDHLCTPELLGNPYADAYGENLYAQNVWDLASYGNKVFIGSGDFDTNTGGVSLQVLNLETSNFQTVCKLPEEQIGNFRVTDYGLFIPGIDSTQTWEYGNWHYFTLGKMYSFLNLPKTAHCFDIIEYDDALWFGLGAVDAPSQVMVSRDGGRTFEYVPFLDNHDEVVDTSRAYNLYVSNGELWAVCEGCNLYRYQPEKGVFKYSYNSLSLKGHFIGHHSEGIPFRVLTYKDSVLFINEDVLVMNADNSFTIPMAESTQIFDAIEEDGMLYLLSGTQTSEGWRVSVYSTEDLDSWEEVLYFDSTNFARSFEHYGDSFYFGLGNSCGDVNVHCGEILKVSI